MDIRLRMCRLLILAVAALVLVTCVPALAAKIEDQFGENEVKLGQEGAAQIAKDYKFSDNADELKRIRDIGNKLAAVANKTGVKAIYGSAKITPFQYEFNIIEDKDVNAFSIPGGHIYVNRGLLDFVQSDQELAGVIAHEVIHASHHHMVYLLKKQASLNNQMAIALLAMMLGGVKSPDIGNVLLGAQLYQISKLNGYGMQAERDADNGAVFYMKEAGYNPVGILTFLERLARRPELVEYGIYRSHPLDDDRVRAAKKGIEALGLPINRRETTNAVKAEVKTETIDGVEVPGVVIKDKVIYRPAPLDGKTSAQRAQETADTINKMLDADLKIHELTVDPNGGVIARGQPLIVVSDVDAKLMGKTPAQVAKAAAAAIRNVLWKQMVDTIH